MTQFLRHTNGSSHIMIPKNLFGCSSSSLMIKNGSSIRLMSTKPTKKPASPNFGSGPCKKRPGWSFDALKDAALGRSHRSKLGKGKLKQAIDETKEVLGIPSDYLVGIVPASDTGAYEMAMWSVLGPKPIDVCQWESFGKGWLTDATAQLKLNDIIVKHEADYGHLPNMSKTRSDADILFTFNGTTSGVRVPNLDFIDDNRTGLTLCDATSAAFAMDMDWKKLDITTFSWQKVLGGEGGHGILILSPRAVERLESYKPEWPLPKIFRMTKNGKINKGIFEGSTINTPSMMCVEDYLDALKWAKQNGNAPGLQAISEKNLSIIRKWVEETEWAHFLAKDPKTVSCTSICLSLDGLDSAQTKELVSMLEKEKVAYDIGSYRDAPPGLRIWGGATVDPADTEALMPWITWAYNEVKSKN